jgi:release factor glutamine methyltransferase
MAEPVLSIREVLKKTVPFLESKGCATARLDAEVLLAETLGTDRLHLYLDMDRPLNEVETSQYRDLVRRRAALEPVAYIVGFKEFRSMPFAVDRRTLIPRPETEHLVEMAIKMLNGAEAPEIFEVGTGSGAVAVSLAREVKEARIWASDFSSGAIEVARQNADQLGVSGRIEFVEGDLFAGHKGPYGLIVSNPPYVPDGDAGSMQKDVVNYEPHEALFAGKNGLDFIARLVNGAAERLRPGGKLIFEIGKGQAEAVEELIGRTQGLRFLTVAPDLQGIPRVAAAERDV